MARLIGTAGHVDHGKSTLIRALTGIDPDRLPEEKQRGMTIDIGFAYLDLPGVGRTSIVDVPGHERFITNMLVGALGIDVGLLCVAADESVMPQTREHLQILELLPVERLVVALTRADLADSETRQFTRLEVEELLSGTRFVGSPVLEASAATGEGIEELKDALAQAMSSPQDLSEGPWYLPIDRAFLVKGHGVVVTGTLAQGSVRVGSKAVILPGGLEVRVRSIHSHGQAQEASEKGRRTALNLGGVKLEDVQRGKAIGEPGALFETSVMDAEVRWLQRPKHAQRVRVSVGAEEAIGKAFLSAPRTDEPESAEVGSEIVQLRLERPVACALRQPLILRRYSPPEVIGGGRVAIPLAKPRRRSERAAVVSAAGDEEAILQVVAGAAEGVATSEICRLMGRSPQALGDAFERLSREGRIRGFAGCWFEPAAFEAAVQRLLASIRTLHDQNPSRAWVARDKAIEVAKLKWSGKPLDRILSTLSREGKIEVEGTLVRLSGHRVGLNDRQRALLTRVADVLDRSGANVPGTLEIAAALHVPPQAVEEILKLGVEAGELVRVFEGIHYTREQLDAFRTYLVETFGGAPFSAAQFRDAFGTSRKYAIPLLEYLDSIRFTLRVGDNRVVKASANGPDGSQGSAFVSRPIR